MIGCRAAGAALLLVVPLAAQQPPLHVARIIAEFGGPVDHPAAELLGVTGVVRTADGRFVVANGKPLEVRLYTADGALVRRLGREGGGPGEFRYRARVFPWPGDSVLTHSSGTDRWMLFTLDGGLVREWPADDAHRVVTGIGLQGSAVMPREIVGSSGCPATALERLAPRTATSFSEAMTDQAGRLWIRPVGRAGPWAVHTPDGRPLARVALPAGFQPMQFSGDQLVGLRRDDDGFYYITAVLTGLPVAAASQDPPCSAVPLPIERVRAAMIKTGMRNAMTFGEAYHADHNRYPAASGDYPSSVKPIGTEFVVLAGGRDGYIISIVDRTSGWRCVVAVGSTETGPLPDGTLVCG